ncbi:MAG: glutamate-ammonia-ligase adenylyltransferase [Planctomycetota bacterium]
MNPDSNLSGGAANQPNTRGRVVGASNSHGSLGEDGDGPVPDADWLAKHGFAHPVAAMDDIDAISACGASEDLIDQLWRRLDENLTAIDNPDETLHALRQFTDVTRSPTSLLSLFERDANALAALLQVLSTSQAIAQLLLSDPESFDLIRASDGRAADRDLLRDELAAELRAFRSPRRAALALRRFAGREILRIAYGEFVHGMSSERVQHQISHVTDAMLHAALQFSVARVIARQGIPQRIDNSQPRFAIIALGNYGGQEIGYEAPLHLLMLCDRIDRKNPGHVEFNRQVADGLVDCLSTDGGPVVSLRMQFIHQPVLDDVPDRAAHHFDSVVEAASYYERTSQTWQRLAFVKARLAAGDSDVGRQFLRRVQPWVYHALLSRSEMADIHVLRRKLEKRAATANTSDQIPIADVPGGRHDIELTIQFLQLLHGNTLPEVRVTNTIDAIAGLSRHGCLTPTEASILSENHAKLCRLEHYLAILFEHSVTHLPSDEAIRRRLAWRLNIRDGDTGDSKRLERLLQETFEVNRKIINHLMVDDDQVQPSLVDGSSDDGLVDPASTVPLLTELVLDPSPDQAAFEAAMAVYGMRQPSTAIDRINALATETVPFIAPWRCRHFFAAVSPQLFSRIAKMPDPDDALHRLVEMTDSIGAKATLWELLRTNSATLTLVVRMVALAPYLTEILVDHPGMIDELIDSLVRDRLPSPERLDSQSQRLVSGSESVGPILRNFKASAHLMIGVRDLLDKDPVDQINAALTHTSEAVLRRVIEKEQERLAARFGDPQSDVDSGHLQPAELVAIGLQKFGGQEINYHSDLDLVFVYTFEGETQRRVGGSRTTLSHRQFFNQLAKNVLHVLGDVADGRIEEIDLPMNVGGNSEILATSLSSFAKPFRQRTAPIWQRLLLCKARPVSGSREAQQRVQSALTDAFKSGGWGSHDAQGMRQLRMETESAARPGNLKRGPGGTLDVEFIAAAGMLQLALQDNHPVQTSTIATIEYLGREGWLSSDDAESLVENIRVLRRVESKLRLLNTVSRHELPLGSNDTVDTHAMRQLAALLDQSDPVAIVNQCRLACERNRQIFDSVFPESPRPPDRKQTMAGEAGEH